MQHDGRVLADRIEQHRLFAGRDDLAEDEDRLGFEALQALGLALGALAQQLGNPGMTQAVGQGVGRNPWSVIVPCHRVLSSTGVLTGYAGGIERKQELLEMESRRAAR